MDSSGFDAISRLLGHGVNRRAALATLAALAAGGVGEASAKRRSSKDACAPACLLGTWGSQGSGEGQFQQPRFVATAPDRTVYVSDANLNRIQAFTRAGEFVDQWGSLGSGDGQLQSPHGVEVAQNGTVYVVDSNNNRVEYFRIA